jgi:hypothetical protein
MVRVIEDWETAQSAQISGKALVGSNEGHSMRSIEVTRAGDRSVTDQLAEMRRWLDRQGVRATDLHAVRILAGRVTFSAVFERAADADRFRRAFGVLD